MTQTADLSIASMFEEWRRIHDRNDPNETEEESEALHVRYRELQDRIIRSKPKTPRDLAMMAYADSGGDEADHSDEFRDRLCALAVDDLKGPDMVRVGPLFLTRVALASPFLAISGACLAVVGWFTPEVAR